jgi:uracil-DNA glycosylase
MREGFFDKELEEAKTSDCTKCKLYQKCKSPRMKHSGKGEKGILIIGEAPSSTEDKKGKANVGQAGKILKLVLQKHGIDLHKDCWKINAVSCRPPEGKEPSKNHIKCCFPRVEKLIKKKKPHLTLVLGGAALNSFLGTRLNEAPGGINKWRGFICPDQRYKTWMTSTFHPSHLLYNPDDKILHNMFRRDIVAGLKRLNKDLPRYGDYKINIHRDEDELIALLCHIQQSDPPELFSFDYETTGLKPYVKGHEIVTCAFHIDKETHAFRMTKKVAKYWKKILRDKHIPKTAQNLKFEHQWGRVVLGVVTRGWVWDTMQASHIIDNRQGVTGLKFQAYANFGQEDYSSHLDKFIKTKKDVEFNKIHKAPIKDVLQYNGMDAVIEHYLAIKQMKELIK